MTTEVWVEKGKGRTLSVNVRLFTDGISEKGEGYIRKGHAWFMRDVSIRPNKPHEVPSIGNEPIMWNRPEELVDAIIKAATAQGVTLFHRKTKEQLTP